MAQTPSVFCLERINSVIDLCIDNELDEELSSFVILYDKPEDLRRILGEGRLPDFNSPTLDKYKLSRLLEPYQDVLGDLDSTLCYKGLDLWMKLFWAKTLRAELRKNDFADQDALYYQLIGFLERNMSPSQPDDGDSVITTINFLMELSALASAEASYGYADRARSQLRHLFKGVEDPVRGPYDRWIAYNKGIAYQHMVERNRLAVLEFNWIIEEFTKLVNKDGGFRPAKHGLEFLLNICPGTLQRSALNLKMQLSYHALQTLVEHHMDWLKDLSSSASCPLFRVAAEKLMLRADLYRLEALLQLEEFQRAKEKLNELYPKLFSGATFTAIEGDLPELGGNENKSSLQIQLVEHAVWWYLLRMRENSSAIRSAQKAKDPAITDHIIAGVIGFDEPEVLKAIESKYWKWIAKSTWFDKRIYFSRWAQFLKVAAERLEQFLRDGVRPENIQKLLDAGISLYLSRHADLPKRRVGHVSENIIQLENLRSDDLSDFAKGLSYFYKSMNRIEKDLQSLKVPNLSESFIKQNKELGLIITLRDDHLRLLDAIDEWEETFAERQRISRLHRCNERLIWFDDQRPGGCHNCLGPSTHAPGHAVGYSPQTRPDNPLVWAFKDLLPCAKDTISDDPEFVGRHLNDSDYQYIMQLTELDLVQHLVTKSQHVPRKKALHFVGLQRWNSETPAQGRSVGGGYFIYRTDEKGTVDLGIAVDPGFDFIRNFFRMGFSLKDIDIVLVSHAHPDHLWDFESIIHLLHELEDKKEIFHRVHAILTLSSYTRLEHVITNQTLRRYVNPLIIDIRKEIDDEFFEKLGKRNNAVPAKNTFDFENTFRFNKMQKENGGRSKSDWEWKLFLPLGPGLSGDTLDIMPTRAYHDDHTERSDSFGFLLNFFASDSSGKDRTPFCLGYTGDSKWVGDDLYNSGCPANSNCSRRTDGKCTWQSTAEQYKQCDVLLTHLGSLIDHKKGSEFKAYKVPEECEKLIRKTNHPYLMGMIRFLRTLRAVSPKPKLILIGEFGEELRGGIRTDLVDRLQRYLTGNWPVLPVDVGLDICLHDLSNDAVQGEGEEDFKFQCVLCERYVSVKQVQYFRFGQDEGIFYLCSTCYKATPEDVRNAKLGRLYEVGRELRT